MNAWQLAVVDWDQALKLSPCLSSYVKNIKTDPRNKDIKSGTVIYVVSVAEKKISAQDNKIIRELAHSNGGTVPIARVWIPYAKRYGYIFLNAIVPLLTEKDIIDAELKFQISIER